MTEQSAFIFSSCIGLTSAVMRTVMRTNNSKEGIAVSKQCPLFVLCHLKKLKSGLSGNPTIEALSRKQLKLSQEVSGSRVQS